ncbi:MAG: cell division protein FtsA [Dehalococcoidia bacterium]|nr:cell division protein FtsA [Dehalococcoidia bacterium]
MQKGMTLIQGDYRAVIDIGTTKVCVILVARRPDRRLEITGLGIAQCDGLRKGVIADTAAVTDAIRRAAEEASQQAGVVLAAAYVGIAGTHIDSDDRWSAVPRGPGVRAVTQDDLVEAVKHVSKFDPAPGQHVLHVIPRTYTLDGLHGVHNPEGMHTQELHVQSQVISGPTEQVEALEAAVNAAGLRCAGVIVEPMATADAVFEPAEKQGVVALVDIGGGKTDIAVFHDGIMVATAMLPVGGYQFTNDLSIAFSLPYADAEKLKVEQGTVIPDFFHAAAEVVIRPTGMQGPLTITHRDIGQILKDRAEELIELVRMKLDIPALAETPVETIVVTGGGAQLRDFITLTKHSLQKKIRLGAPKGLDGLPETHRDPSIAAAAGMAMWAMRNLPAEGHAARPYEPSAGVIGTLRGLLPHAKSDVAKKTPAKV